MGYSVLDALFHRLIVLGVVIKPFEIVRNIRKNISCDVVGSDGRDADSQNDPGSVKFELHELSLIPDPVDIFIGVHLKAFRFVVHF